MIECAYINYLSYIVGGNAIIISIRIVSDNNYERWDGDYAQTAASPDELINQLHDQVDDQSSELHKGSVTSSVEVGSFSVDGDVSASASTSGTFILLHYDYN